MSSVRAVSIRIGPGYSERTRRQIERPSSPGSIRSRTTRSGSRARIPIDAVGPVGLEGHAEAVGLQVIAGQLGQALIILDDQYVILLGRVQAVVHLCVIFLNGRAGNEGVGARPTTNG